jgi:hypothetical protein
VCVSQYVCIYRVVKRVQSIETCPATVRSALDSCASTLGWLTADADGDSCDRPQSVDKGTSRVCSASTVPCLPGQPSNHIFKLNTASSLCPHPHAIGWANYGFDGCGTIAAHISRTSSRSRCSSGFPPSRRSARVGAISGGGGLGAPFRR